MPLRLGYVGIKNRSQADINDKISVRKALDAEKLYFSQHPVYSTISQNLLGAETLTTKLSKVLFTHIKHNLPEIMREIKDKIRDIDDRLSDLGP